MAQPKTQYIPGVCNIGPTEIASRRRTGYISLAVSIVIAVLLFAFPVNHWFRLIVALPLFAAFSAGIQVRSHFCAGFGMTGLFNFSNELGKTETADQAEWRAKDKQRALQITFQSLALGIVVALILVFI